MEGALDMLSVFREVGMQRVLVTGSGQQSVLDNISRDFPECLTMTNASPPAT